MPVKRKKSKRSAHAKLSTMGSAIMSRAKKLYREHPGRKWTSCVSAAAKSLKK